MIKYVSLLALLFSNLLAIAQCEVSNGLIHRWEFDGNLTDQIGSLNGSSGVAGIGYITDRFGNPGNALNITNNNRSVTPSSAIPFTSEMTISFWAKFSGQPANSFIGQIGSITTSGSLFNYGDMLTNSSTLGAFGMLYNTGTSGQYIWAAPQPLNEWQLVTITKQDSIFSLYVNNTFVTAQKPYYFSTATTTSMLRLFGRESFPTNPIGAFDDYRIYNRILSANEMDSLMSAVVKPTITQDLESLTICPNSSINSLQVGGNLISSYQWYKNGSPISNSNVEAQLFLNPTITNSGLYKVVVSNVCNLTDTSSEVSLSYGTTNFTNGLIGFYTQAGYNSVPSSAQLGYAAPLNSATGTNPNVSNRVGINGTANELSLKSAGWSYQYAFNDSTSSVSLWYKYNATTATGNSYILGTANGGSSSLMINSAGVVGLWNGAFVASSKTLTDATWYHIAVVKNGTKEKIYINEELVLDVTNSISLATSPITLLGNSTISNVVNSGAFGIYDDIRFYNKPLNFYEVHNLYAEVILTKNTTTTNAVTYVANITQCDSSDFQLEVDAKTSLPYGQIKYQWYKDGVPLTNSNHFMNVDTRILLVDNFQSADEGAYKCEITLECMSFQTSVVNLLHSTIPGPNIDLVVTQPVCDGELGEVIVSVSGSNLSPTQANPTIYRNGLIVSNVNSNLPIGQYNFKVYSDNFGCISSKQVLITSPGAPFLAYDDAGTTTCGVGNTDVTIISCDSVNTNAWTHLYNNQGKVIASINSNGQDLGLVTATLYNEINDVNTINANNDLAIFTPKYLHKMWKLSSEIAPTSPVNVRFYYTEDDLNTLKQASGCAGCNQYDLILSHVSGIGIDCDASNNTMTNFNIYWNKNPWNTAQEQGHINSFVNGTVTNMYGNVSTSNLGGSNSNGAFVNDRYFEAVVNQFSEFRLHMLGNTPLPIIWNDFSVELENQHTAHLKWSVSSEMNSSHYNIERSSDAKTWNAIAKVNSKGNSSIGNEYNYIDETLAPGIWYYRIKQVDIDNHFLYSSVQKINVEQLSDILIYPNPTTGNIIISTQNWNENVSVSIFSIDGKLLMMQEVSQNNSNINLNRLQSGTYIVQVKQGDKISYNKITKN